MKNGIKRGIVLMLIMSMVISMFAGCGKDKNANKITINKNAIYKEAALEVGIPAETNVYNIAVGKNKLFFSGYDYSDLGGEKYFLYSCNHDGTGLKSVTVGDEKLSSWIDRIIATEDGNLLIYYNSYFYDDSDPENYVYENYNYFAVYDGELNELKKVDVTERGIDYINNMVALPGGNYLLVHEDKFTVLDSELNVVKEKSRENSTYISNLYKLKDGSLCVYYWGEGDGKDKLARFNADTLEMGDNIDFSYIGSGYSILQGNDKYDFFLRDSSCVYGYNLGDTEPVALFNMVDSDVSTGRFNSLEMLPDGSFIGVYNEFENDTYKVKVSRFTKVDPSDVVEKKLISLGTIYMEEEIRKIIVDFNKSNDEYRVVVKDYSTYNTDDDYEGGVKRLNADIAAGQAPDVIFANDNRTISNYASKGLFLDLHTFLDKDGDINKADIFPNLITSLETDGKLYSIAPYFYIQSLVGKKSLLGDRKGWTLQEMREYEKTIPEGSSLFTKVASREQMLSTFLTVYGQSLVDMKTGNCNFNSDEFKELLTYLSEFKSEEEISYDDDYWQNYEGQWRSNSTILYPWYFSSPSDLKYTLSGTFGEDVAFVGYPSPDRQGSVLYYYNQVAISSKCKNTEGAWAFVKTLWGADYQSRIQYGIPASMSQFDIMCAKAMERPSYEENGVVTYYDDTYWIGDTAVTLEPLTQAQIDDIKNFALSVEKSSASIDSEIFTIINEEAAPFFAGQKSVDDACNVIQNRAYIYIKEKQ